VTRASGIISAVTRASGIISPVTRASGIISAVKVYCNIAGVGGSMCLLTLVVSCCAQPFCIKKNGLLRKDDLLKEVQFI
jgi:hypothetical protein